MILQNPRTIAGALIAAKGFELSHAWIERLQNYEQRGLIPAQLKVQMSRRCSIALRPDLSILSYLRYSKCKAKRHDPCYTHIIPSALC